MAAAARSTSAHYVEMYKPKKPAAGFESGPDGHVDGDGREHIAAEGPAAPWKSYRSTGADTMKASLAPAQAVASAGARSLHRRRRQVKWNGM